jgi:hypothetical protein
MEQQTIRMAHTRLSSPFLMRGRVWPEKAQEDRIHPQAHSSSPRISKQAAVDNATRVAQWASWLRSSRGPCKAPSLPDLDRAFVNPAAVFGSPEDVVRHPLLTIDCKREILWRWAWDEYLLDLANADGMAEGEPSRLPEVKKALRLVSTEWSPDPAAPAAFIVHYCRDDNALAA